jgi:hypothetical protein
MKYTWTAFCAFKEDPRGQYSEEIDVQADTPTHAKQAAEKLLADGYDPRLKVRRVVRRAPGYFF